MQRDTKPPLAPRRRLVYNLLGWLCFGLGLLGMVVPLMPTTVFWICATWLWLRSSPHRVRFLVEHPRFGASIRRFLEHGEICRSGKKAAGIGMAGSFLIWSLVFRPGLAIALLVATILGAVFAWIWTRPELPTATAPQPVRVRLSLEPQSLPTRGTDATANRCN